MKIPIDLEKSRHIGADRLTVACADGRAIDVYQDGNSLVATEGGRELWRYEKPPYEKARFNGLKFDGYDALLRRAERGRDPTGYIIAHLRSSETDDDSHDLNRGVGIILDPLTGEEISAFGPSW